MGLCRETGLERTGMMLGGGIAKDAGEIARLDVWGDLMPNECPILFFFRLGPATVPFEEWSVIDVDNLVVGASFELCKLPLVSWYALYSATKWFRRCMLD